MNISGLSNNSWLGKALRLPLRLIPPEIAFPILQTKMRGFKWIVGSSEHGCWLGSYEYCKRKLFEETVTPGSVVFDIGANVGFYTLLASVLVGPQGKVFAFEPAPRNVGYLRRHLRINEIRNASVVNAAVSDRSGTGHMDVGRSTSTGYLAAGGRLAVRTVSLDELVNQGELPRPDYLKIDVEGAELLVLAGAALVLESTHPTIFLATHGRLLHQQCCQFLKLLGYQLRPIDGDTLEGVDEVIAIPGQESRPCSAES